MTDASQGELFKELPTVSEITHRLSQDLSRDYRDIALQGEISNFRKAASGHMYFVLKDAQAQLRAVMFKGQGRGLKFLPADGLQVEARGDITLYEPRGDVQIILKEMRPAGLGGLMAAFHRLKEKLEEEGLFSPDRKKPLPAMPETIALVTSPQGAALRDMVHVSTRRWPGLRLVLVPVLVQGAEAAEAIASGIAAVDQWGQADVLVVGRGGGSLEDLWAFNEEPVVRAVAECRTPVVSAVGHETDTTLTDFAADLRAATPSAAMEHVVPERVEIVESVRRLASDLHREALSAITSRRREVRRLVQAYGFRRPEIFLQRDQVTVDRLAERLNRGWEQRRESLRQRIASLGRTLDSLDPSQVLGRGYAWVRSPEGASVQSARDMPQRAIVQFARDRAVVEVKRTEDRKPFDPVETES